MNTLSPEQIERYSRQLILPGWNSKLQTHFQKLHVSVPADLPSAAFYLAAVGVGAIMVTGESQKIAELEEELKSFEPALRLNESSPPDCQIKTGAGSGSQFSGENPLVFLMEHVENGECLVPEHLTLGTRAALEVIAWWIKQGC